MYQWLITVKAHSLPRIITQYLEVMSGVDKTSIKAQKKMGGKVKFVFEGNEYGLLHKLNYLNYKSNCSILKIKRGYRV